MLSVITKGDMRALEDLTYERRREFLKEHHLPDELPVVSFRTEASISPAVLATLSHVAHAELPTVAGEPKKLPVVMPLGAAMAACAQLLQVRYGEKSDGLVTCRDAEVPGSVVVRPKRKLDHAWMVYSSLNDDPKEGDASQVCEALLYLLVELGQKKRHGLERKEQKQVQQQTQNITILHRTHTIPFLNQFWSGSVYSKDRLVQELDKLRTRWNVNPPRGIAIVLDKEAPRSHLT
ncbi:hypothetical protein Ahy_A02g009491 isoform C [Arachis hypogaea]|uniref:Uncharacterized protein n=1 Tax=Arachis hypogaea TaxID=3818 RepID=A0A445EHE5_ARAHY|nr:hypothetical protein Ahy_A02g009491 isoform C [Arachis hypogaea]